MVSDIDIAGRDAGLVGARSAVSWAAVFAGAFVMAACGLVLAAIGGGFGLATVSPWPGDGRGAVTFALLGGLWLIVVQWIASGLGGYITGRLRTRWHGVHDHEVFFRDTAHGFLTWSFATVVAAVTLGSALTMAAGKSEPAPAQAGAGDAVQSAAVSYDVDALFRAASASDPAARTEAKGEANRILTAGLATGGPSDADRAYLVQLISARAGVSADTARIRVQATIDREIAVAQAAKKAASAAAIFGGLSMLIGAFIACVAAALGGQQRDLHP
jgi:hypothetical protein